MHIRLNEICEEGKYLEASKQFSTVVKHKSLKGYFLYIFPSSNRKEKTGPKDKINGQFHVSHKLCTTCQSWYISATAIAHW